MEAERPLPELGLGLAFPLAAFGGQTGGGGGGGGGGGSGGGAGTTWTLRQTGVALTDVTYANGLFVAVEEYGTILTSSDGVSWTAQTSGRYTRLLGVTHGNGLFVAVGDWGTVLTSP
mgnify:CR=1 FL=1